MDDADGQENAEHGTNAETEQRGRKRDPRVIDEATLRGDRLVEGRIPDLGDNLMRRRQHRPLLRHGVASDLGKTDLGAGTGGGVALEGCVQEHGSDVPDHDQ
ncbi:hypothetical protein D9M68_943080 [compost metagenome]